MVFIILYNSRTYMITKVRLGYDITIWYLVSRTVVEINE